MRSEFAKAQNADDMATEKAVARAIEAAMAALGASAMSDAAIAALSRGNIDAFLRAIDWDAFGLDMTEGMLDRLAGVYLSRGLRAMHDLSPVTALLDFELLEPRAIQWATLHAGARVVQVSNEVRSQVRAYVVQALADKVDVMTTARLIRGIIPLHSRFAAAVQNTYSRQLAAGIKAGRTPADATARAAAVADKQAARLLRVRSETIARTEIMSASNAGRYEGWATQVANGNVSADSRKEWTVGDEPCPDCDPSEGEVVRWDEPFSNGEMMPPLHPGCRCTAVLLPPDEELRGPKEPGEQAPKGGAPTSNPDLPGKRPGVDRKLNAGDLTNEQGRTIAASAMRAARGEVSQADHRAFVRDYLGVDSQGRYRNTN